MRLEDSDVYEEEKVQDAMKNLPGSKTNFDHWDTLLREFVQGTALDLRNKQLTAISPKLMQYTHLTVVDLSNNPIITSLPQDIDLLTSLKTLRVCSCGLKSLPRALLNLEDLQSLELNNNKLT